MANTLIQIKRSATTLAPSSLGDGELAYSGNTLSERLFIGHPTGNVVTNIAGKKFEFLQRAQTANSTHAYVEGGTTTANAVVITNANNFVDAFYTNKLVVGTDAETINVTSISVDGTLTTVSNSMLATAWAIKDYVDNNSAATLEDLDDVDVIGTQANNTYLVYDGAAAKWEAHTIVGTANEVELTYSNNDLQIGLPNNVTIGGILTVSGQSNQIGAAQFSNTVDVDGQTTLASVNVEDLTDNRIVIAGTSGEIEDDANFTMDGTTFKVGATPNVFSVAVGTGNVRTNGTLLANGVATFASNVAIQDSLTVTGTANVTSTSYFGANVEIDADLSVTGDLNVTGTLTYIDTENVVVEDSLIRLSRNQANTGTFTDQSDIGFYGVYGNTTSTIFTGLFRNASSNTFVLFDGLDQSPDNIVNTNAISVTTLNAYLDSGGLTTNTTNVSLTANSTTSVNMVANTLTLSQKLDVTEGGTGVASFANNGVLYGFGAGDIQVTSAGTYGQVLQVNSGGTPEFGVLDGGTF